MQKPSRDNARLGVGLLGYGYASKTIHAPLIRTTQELELRGIYSSRPADVLADLPEMVVKTQVDKLLAHPGIDLIVIATPNETHYPLARAALAAGKHVVIDKPFTLDLAEARDLARKAEETGLLLSVFHNRRWDDDFLLLKQLISENRLGRICEFVSRFDRYRPQVRQRWRESAAPGAGLWYDLGPHLVDQAIELFGLPEAVSADMAMRRKGAASIDDFCVTLHYPHLRAQLCASTLASGGLPRFALHGEQASLTIDGLDEQESWLKRGLMPGQAGWGHSRRCAKLYCSHNDVSQSETLSLPEGHYDTYYRQIALAIFGIADSPVSPESACQVMRILDLARRSASEGRRVALI